MDVTEQSAPEAELETPSEVAQDPADTATEDGAQPDEQSEAPLTEAELVEVERNGKKYAIPKELEPELLMQSDYTRKAQEVAEHRKELERHQQLFQQAVTIHRENQQAYVALASIDHELQKYAGVDWNALTQADPGRAQQAFVEYQALRDRRSQAAAFVSQREQQLMQAQEHAQRENLRAGVDRLQKEIPGGFTSELAGRLLEQGRKEGWPDAKLSSLDDPVAVKLLWKARQYDQMVEKAKKAQPKPAETAQVIPAKTSAKAPESMSTEEWMKWRDRQAKARK